MLTRRQIRVKVMQAIYAHYNGNQLSLKEGTTSIAKSCKDMLLLHTSLLALFKALWDYAVEQDKIQNTQRRGSAPLNKDYPIIAALEPVALIAKHPFLAKKIEQNKLNTWELEFDYVRQLFDTIVSSEIYLEYKAKENFTFKNQQKFLVQVFKEVVAPDERLFRYIEDLNIQWIDDLPVVNTFILKQFRKLRAQDLSSLTFPDLSEREEDIQFGKSLYENVIVNQEALQKEFDGKTPNWDKDRIAALDGILIKIAIAELIHFPDIPPKVTLNEYLELAKEYSTPKSNQFINGVLDNLVKEYIKDDRLKKEGRGLLE
ncbi:MAG: transcription antitermination factor NusB [Flavobacteriaceae bacterium]